MESFFPNREQLEDLQLQKLRRLLAILADQNPFWSQRLSAADISSSIGSLNDLRRLPFLTKQELVEDQAAKPPYGTNLTFPLPTYVRLHQTSGTTGRPMRWLDTAESWDWFMECWSQIYDAVGMGATETVAFPFSFGPFIGFWAAFDGAVRRGYRCIPLGGLSTETRLEVILQNRVSTICCTPTYALRMTAVAQANQLQIRDAGVKRFIFAGEPGAALGPIRNQIQDAWGARVFDHWGMTDVGSLGIEAAAEPGVLRILEKDCIAEVISPETGAPTPVGELGELVITNLGRTGQPVLRYRTGDLVKSKPDRAPDGCPYLRLNGGILGRSDDMVVIRGNNVFPSSIDALVRELPEIAEYRATVKTVRAMPHLILELEPQAATPPDGLSGKLDRYFKERLGFQIELVIVPPLTLPRFEMKGKRFFRVS